MSRASVPEQGGLTLLEMLVTLVIVSMISAILWQALQQLARVERSLEEGSIPEANTALRQEWLRLALESVLPQMGKQAFEGDEKTMRGLAAELPGATSGELGSFELSIERDQARASGQRLVLTLGNVGAGEEASRVILLEWVGATGEFRYVDASGQLRPAWRPADLKPGESRLPRAILVRTGHERFGLLIAGVRNSGVAPPARSVIEKL